MRLPPAFCPRRLQGFPLRWRCDTVASSLSRQWYELAHRSSSSADTPHSVPETSNTTATTKPTGTLRYPDAPTSEHHDIHSYAAYAERTGLDVTSKTFVGTLFEYTVAAALRPLGFELKRIGGRSDYGIDLIGTWAVPSFSTTTALRVLLQCKATAQGTQIRPSMVRELEGAFVGAPPGWRGSGVLGLLVAQKPATKGIRDSLARSRWPMGYISCSGDGALEQMIWNRRAEEEGLEGMGITVQHWSDDLHAQNVDRKQQLVLTWKGKPYVPADNMSSV